ncbi:protein-tyrosine phosphatase-like protein [Dactylonectria macrodidyma]|uniref:Protein-tyrosine phosphatase-like protein n=1 Tax=Dactylonectria macrodidyma TaxID=307937 RepID=A0A9P9E5U8_9HYPO|nr:protein-tyrosine phosphatase-like protein [Dactylonectria macrodidyma]
MSASLVNPTISMIEPGLYLGDRTSSYDIQTLTENKISAIVSLTRKKLAVWSSPQNRELVPENRHLIIPCMDTSTQDIIFRMPEICDFIDAQRGNGADGKNVLIHCTAGVSRSATVVVAYLMRRDRKSSNDALAAVRKKRNIRPNPGFQFQLHVWAKVDYQPCDDLALTIPKPAYAEFLSMRRGRLELRTYWEDI